MVLKVAVIGLAPSSHGDAPWLDTSWDKWGLPWDDKGWPYMSRTFEMHDKRLLDSEHSLRGTDYLDRLNDCERLYIQKSDERLPRAQEYPFLAVSKSIGQSYWNSSIAYAMAMAIYEGATQIGIWGVDMDGTDEYAYQRPNMEYLIGVARGKGIDVYIPESSALCKFQGSGIKFYNHDPVYQDRYGWLG